MNLRKIIAVFAPLILTVITCACEPADGTPQADSLSDIPAYSGSPYVELNGNIPDFPDSDKDRGTFEMYSPLDSLNRCGAAYAKLGYETMPTEKREDISSVKPTGWMSTRYDFVEGGSLYNRCHLIGFQLCGENANEMNLITGTRYMNVKGMLPFENEVADYIISTGNHVMYRATPIFEGNNLLASGVQIEAESVEDGGFGLRFNVYCYNVQPGVTIYYDDGRSHPDGDNASGEDNEKQDYVLNTKSMKFHKPDCDSVKSMNPQNRLYCHESRVTLIDAGYSPCNACIVK